MLSTPPQMKTSPAPSGSSRRRYAPTTSSEPQKRLTVHAAHRFRQARQQADEARDIQALLALGKGAAQDEILDILRLATPVLPTRPRDHLRGQIVRPHRASSPLLARVKGERA